jgi:hypothetical protein
MNHQNVDQEIEQLTGDPEDLRALIGMALVYFVNKEPGTRVEITWQDLEPPDKLVNITKTRNGLVVELTDDPQSGMIPS